MKAINRNLIKENTEYLKQLFRDEKNKKIALRIQMLIILKENPNMTLKEVMNLLSVSYSTVCRWWNYYKEGGLNKLLEWNVEGYKGKLIKEQEKEFLKELEKGRFSTQKEMIEWIKEKYGIEYSQQGMSDLLKRLKVKKKVVRPKHPDKNDKQEEEFKKEFKKIAKENKEIFF